MVELKGWRILKNYKQKSIARQTEKLHLHWIVLAFFFHYLGQPLTFGPFFLGDWTQNMGAKELSISIIKLNEMKKSSPTWIMK